MAEQYRIAGGTATAIAGSVEEGVRRGALRPDEALPSVRALAGELGVSPATVAAAYQRLRARGIIATDGRRGTRVRTAPPIATLRSALKLRVPAGVRDLSEGAPDLALLPDLSAVVRALPEWETVGYSRGGVLPEVLEEARRRLPRVGAGAGYTLCSGALDAIDRLLVAKVRPGDRVGVEDPGWAALLDLLAMHGVKPVPMRVDDEGPAVEAVKEALEAGVSAVILTARAQNPTGAAISAARAKALRPLLRDVFVIEDDHAGELAGVPLHPVVGEGAQWAFVRSLSKPYGPDLRCAVLMGDPETVSRVEGRMRLGAGWISTHLQRCVLKLWREFDPAEAGKIYDRRRNALLEALRERGIGASGRTGINVWVPVPDETKAVALLRDAGYAVAPGHIYRLAGPPAIRVTTATLRPEEVQPLAAAIAEVCELESPSYVGR